MLSFLKVYCWEGVHTIKFDREAALDAACRIAEEESGQLIKASQGREPPHMLQIYNGTLKILAGRHRDFRKHRLRVLATGMFVNLMMFNSSRFSARKISCKGIRIDAVHVESR